MIENIKHAEVNLQQFKQPDSRDNLILLKVAFIEFSVNCKQSSPQKAKKYQDLKFSLSTYKVDRNTVYLTECNEES